MVETTGVGETSFTNRTTRRSRGLERVIGRKRERDSTLRFDRFHVSPRPSPHYTGPLTRTDKVGGVWRRTARGSVPSIIAPGNDSREIRFLLGPSAAFRDTTILIYLNRGVPYFEAIANSYYSDKSRISRAYTLFCFGRGKHSA